MQHLTTGTADERKPKLLVTTSPSEECIQNTFGAFQRDASVRVDARGGVRVYIESPYEIAKEKAGNLTLYDARVHPPWYLRYFKSLPLDFHDSLLVQPFKEIEQRQCDVALGKYFGFDHPCLKSERSEACENLKYECVQRHMRELDANDRETMRLEVEYQKNFQKIQSLPQVRRLSTRVSHSQLMMWLSKREQGIASGAINAIVSVGHKNKITSIAQKRASKINIGTKSKWNKIKKRSIQLNLLNMDKAERAILRLRQLFKGVRWASVFCRIILKRIREPFQIYQNLEDNIRQINIQFNRKFDASTYESTQKMSKRVQTTLNTPWRSRTKEDIKNVMTSLRDIGLIAVMPTRFQELWCGVAWCINIPDKKRIIRQGQIAENFYIILSGAVLVQRFTGNTAYGEAGKAEYLKTFGRYEMFGDDVVSAPFVCREYDAYALGPTCLLAISMDEYQEMTLDREWNDVEPEHTKLLRTVLDGLEFHYPPAAIYTPGNVVYHYFAHGAVIACSAKHAEYVYIVFSGTVWGLNMVHETVIDKLTEQGDVQPRLSCIQEMGKKSIAGSKCQRKPLSEIVPSDIPYKDMFASLQTRYVIQRTLNAWKTLTPTEQQWVFKHNFPQEIRKYFKALVSGDTAGAASARVCDHLRNTKHMANLNDLYKMSASLLPEVSDHQLGKTVKKSKENLQKRTSSRERVNVRQNSSALTQNSKTVKNSSVSQTNSKDNISIQNTKAKHTSLRNTNVDSNGRETPRSEDLKNQTSIQQRTNSEEQLSSSNKNPKPAKKASSQLMNNVNDNQSNSNVSDQSKRRNGTKHTSQISRSSQKTFHEKKAFTNGTGSHVKHENELPKVCQALNTFGRTKSAILSRDLTGRKNTVNKNYPSHSSSFTQAKTKDNKTSLPRIKSAPCNRQAVSRTLAPPCVGHTSEEECEGRNRNNSAVLTSSVTDSKKSKTRKHDKRIKISKMPTILSQDGTPASSFVSQRQSFNPDYFSRRSQSAARKSVDDVDEKDPNHQNRRRSSAAPNQQTEEELYPFPRRNSSGHSFSEASEPSVDLDLSSTDPLDQQIPLGNPFQNFKGENALFGYIMNAVKTVDSDDDLETKRMSLGSALQESADPNRYSQDLREPKPISKTDKSASTKRELRTVFTRGSAMGYEWIDLNDGKCRPPDKDYSMISQGAAVVMIKKEILLSYKRSSIASMASSRGSRGSY